MAQNKKCKQGWLAVNTSGRQIVSSRSQHSAVCPGLEKYRKVYQPGDCSSKMDELSNANEVPDRGTQSSASEVCRINVHLILWTVSFINGLLYGFPFLIAKFYCYWHPTQLVCIHLMHFLCTHGIAKQEGCLTFSKMYRAVKGGRVVVCNKATV